MFPSITVIWFRPRIWFVPNVGTGPLITALSFAQIIQLSGSRLAGLGLDPVKRLIVTGGLWINLTFEFRVLYLNS